VQTKKRRIQVLEYVLAAIAAAALGYCLSVYLYERISQEHAKRNFDKKLIENKQHSAPPPTAPGQQRPAEGTAVAELAIPRLGLTSMVVEGVNAKDLRIAAGHIPGTPLPGENGNVAIAAHRDTFFRPLRFIRKADTINLTTFGGEKEYRVVSMEIVDPHDVRVLYPTGRDTLTLVTCYPFNYIGSAPKRFIVRAERIAGGP
jgi:sortase A